jgi:acylglycerol lipase
MSSEATYAEAWLSGPQSTQFYTRTYSTSGDAKAVIVFIHGFAEHIGRYTHFHPLLSKHGIAVFTFDQRGYGKTAQDTEGHRSKDSAYGKTSWNEQMTDIEWALRHAKEGFPGIPVFLMGHSMVGKFRVQISSKFNRCVQGGAEALGFATQGEKSSRYAIITSLAGVISTSPFIEQATPAPKILRWVGGKASNFAPHITVSAPVNPAVRITYLQHHLLKTLQLEMFMAGSLS